MQPNPYAVHVTTQQLGQPVVVAPGQQVIAQPVPAGQPMYYVQAPPAQQQVVQHQVVTAPVQTQPVLIASHPGYVPSFNRNYAATAPGVFKIIEFFSLLISWSCAARYKEAFGFVGPNSRLQFFLAVFIFAWLLVMLFFFLYVASCHKQCGGAVVAVLGAVSYAIFTVLLLVASGLLADDANNLSPYYDHLPPKYKEYINNLYVAVAFGFISVLLLFVDAILFCAHEANRVPATPPPLIAAEQQPGVFLPQDATEFQ